MSISLEDGSRVGVIGGGPAGSFFAYFLLSTGQRIDPSPATIATVTLRSASATGSKPYSHLCEAW
jgi:flavin-dependent dehydrogenase